MPKVKNIIAALPEPENIDLDALRAALADGTITLVCVLGPTASGKTRYAVQLAHELGKAEIISADSRQVYRGMDIGTGKDLDEYGDVPYHLIDIAEPGDGYNVHRFQEDFNAAYELVRSRGAVPILCGGTGLYISAVTASYDFETKKPLSAPLTPTAAKATIPLHPQGTGGVPPETPCVGLRPPEAAPSAAIPRTFFIGTLVSREVRNARIDARLDARLQEGMVDEIRGLLNSGVPASVLLGYGLEYKFVTQYLLGELSYDQMREHLAIAIHQFAKRQMTWFRGMERSGVRIHWVEP
ncbi:MAG: tRNA dimethylallyltransferase [Bacteroidales bacterium]|nr:tRNA dimethylallyltransferase [Bacteroidales bacterium]